MVQLQNDDVITSITARKRLLIGLEARKKFMDPIPSRSSASTLTERLFAPLVALLPNAKNQRLCHAMADESWIKNGVERALIEMESGCGFLQGLHYHPSLTAPRRSTYFEGLKSARRLDHLGSLNEALTHSHAQNDLREKPDAGLHDSLANFHIHAGDGHFHAASTHENRDYKGKKNPIAHLYTLNLRTGLLNHLGLSGKGSSSRKPHDMGTLKRLEIDSLRQGALKGQKVLYVWDRAGLDYRAWSRWKQGSGIYFLSREKSNTAFMKCGHLPFDREDPINAGVVSNEQGAPGDGIMLRRITFISPDNGEELAFLTNLPNTIPPGVVAQLYFMRWRIEKSFDVFKNKLHEQKAWAKSEAAKEAHAGFLVLAYNLGWLLHQKLEREEDIQDQTNDKKRGKRSEELRKKTEMEKRQLPELRKSLQVTTQLSVKYWRWIRSQLRNPTSWPAALNSLRLVYASF